jgi:histidyl-tRNA synthetase
MTRVKPRRPSGFGEYLPAEQIEFNRLLDIIRSTYEKYGFAPIDTPDIELSEVLLAKGGGETEQEVYRFTREGSDKDLTLRYDLTVPLARYVAEHESNLVFPFRRYHIGKVHRAERAQAGRFREFYQCDIDTIGSNSPLVDAEFPAIINEIFEQFQFGEFVIRLNNRQILNGFFEALGMKSLSGSVMRAIDKMEKISPDAFVKLLKDTGLSAKHIEGVQALTAIQGTNDEVLAALESLEIENDLFTTGLDSLKQVVAALRMMNVPEHRFQIDPKIARGLDYYTGTVYETNLLNYPGLGSVCSGGRYDDLAGYYTKTPLSGVGISIGLSRLFYALQKEGVIIADQQSPAHTIVIPVAEEQHDYAIRVAASLRARSIPVVLHTESEVMAKKLRFANRMGFSHAVIVGPQEEADQTVQLKQLHERTEKSVKLESLAKAL